MKSKYLLTAFVFLSVCFLAACNRSQTLTATPDDEQTVGYSGFYSEDKAGSKLSFDSDVFSNEEMRELRQKIGYTFLVEQFSVKIFPSMVMAIKNHPPAGIVYWNPENVDAEALAKVNATYSLEAEKSGFGPLLFSTDYEGGGYSLSMSGKNIPGIQRFTKGFTKLVHPSWLGQSMQVFGEEMCELHGKIMALELRQAGINYPLATVSDLAKNLFTVRGISKDPGKIVKCMKSILGAFREVDHSILVTKHFPGLGETSGDTHEGTVISKAQTKEEIEPSVIPFRQLIDDANSSNQPEALSILAGHAKYKPLDNEHITTVSSKILKNFLRDEMKFRGLVLSDAMWMGEYGKLGNDELIKVYLQSILAGMDVLMIPGRTFVPAISFFRSLFDGTTSENLKLQLEEKFKMPYSNIRKAYIIRLRESSMRLAASQKILKPAHRDYNINQYLMPIERTRDLSKRYYEIFEQIR